MRLKRVSMLKTQTTTLPATGTLNIYRTPTHSEFSVSDVRVDDGVREGDVISPYYDSDDCQTHRPCANP